MLQGGTSGDPNYTMQAAGLALSDVIHSASLGYVIQILDRGSSAGNSELSLNLHRAIFGAI